MSERLTTIERWLQQEGDELLYAAMGEEDVDTDEDDDLADDIEVVPREAVEITPLPLLHLRWADPQPKISLTLRGFMPRHVWDELYAFYVAQHGTVRNFLMAQLPVSVLQHQRIPHDFLRLRMHFTSTHVVAQEEAPGIVRLEGIELTEVRA